MSEPSSRPSERPRKKAMHPLLVAGVALMLASLAWWLAYYSAYGGWFGVLDIKYLCLSGWMQDCDEIQAQIGTDGLLPAFNPLFWWAGTLLMLVGLYLTARNRRG